MSAIFGRINNLNSELALGDGENTAEVRGQGTGQEGGTRRAGLPVPRALVGCSESADGKWGRTGTIRSERFCNQDRLKF